MIPLNDNVRRQTFWLSTFTLIAINTAVFVYELSLGPSINRFIVTFGLIPARYTTTQGAIIISGLSDFLVPVFTSMFIHGGWLHLLGNMLFLFVFGRSIEDRFGHSQFLFLYFASGFGAAAVEICFNMGLTDTHHRGERSHRRNSRRLSRQLSNGPYHDSDPFADFLLGHPDTRFSDSRVLVCHSIHYGSSDVGYRVGHERWSRLVGPRRRVLAGNDSCPGNSRAAAKVCSDLAVVN